MRLRKAVPAALMAGLLAMPAMAGGADLAAARQGGHWAGCVYQPGYEPYPVELDRTKFGLKVTYPKLCVGIHAPKAGNDADAVEHITGDPGICIPVLDVDYRLRGKNLYLDYYRDGEMIGQARLHNIPKGTRPKLCNPAGTTS